jgi:hypothetical protein
VSAFATLHAHWRAALAAPLIALLALAASHPADAARRALVVGNDNYTSVSKLRNARADAEAMADAFRQAGYEVDLVTDRNLKQLQADVRSFRQKVAGGDEVVVFFSGHGVQLGGTNYLLPTDVGAQNEDQVKDDALSLSNILEGLRERKPRFTLAIIDACRDNPFASTGRAIGGRGLTGVAGASGQMVIYAAGEGQRALDRLGGGDTVRNGLFTRVFLKEIAKPGVPIRDVLYRVRDEVATLAEGVKHEQVPAVYDQVRGTFYFLPPRTATAESVVTAVRGPEPAAVVPLQPAVIAPVVVAALPQDNNGVPNFIWPTAGPVVTPFKEGAVKGIVVGGPAGASVYAAAEGKVIYAGSGIRGYGHLVIIKHNLDFMTAYAHNRALLVKEDQVVSRGQAIAEMGSSDADRVQLGFEIRHLGKAVDPLRYLPQRP